MKLIKHTYIFLLIFSIKTLNSTTSLEVEFENIQSFFSLMNDRLSTLSDIEVHQFNSLEREKWIKEKAESVPKNFKVLDVGAGSGPYRSFFNHCQYFAHDFAQNTDHIAYAKLDYISDITSIPVQDASFDVVLCTEVLEHVPYPIEALKEIARVLKKGGRLFLTAPLGSGLHQLPYHYYGGYTPEWYKKFGSEFGLDMIEIAENGGFFKLLGQECGRVSWLFNLHKDYHGKQQEFIQWLFFNFLPRYLLELDEKCFIKDFTVGYHVEAVKK